METKKEFPLGRVVVTATALSTIDYVDIVKAFARHAACDWGDCDPDDLQENDRSLEEGSRLLSVYHDRRGTKFWVITEADRSVTTVLLPEDY